jgi:tryptophan-rich sensory protein
MASFSFDRRFDVPRRSTPAQAIGFVLWLALAFAAAGVGAVASIDAAEFYGQLVKPDWAPPAGLFGPVWTALYLLMGVAAWLVWREKRAKGLALSLSLFVIQLLANALWSWLFFAWRMGAFALVDVLALLALIVATAITFWRIRKAAGVLFIPYIAWVAFASVLTYSVWQSNPDKL